MEEKKLCKYCKKEISKDAKICPYCRKKQGVKVWLIVLIVILFLGVVGAITDNSTNQQVNNQTQQPIYQENTPAFTISEITVEKDILSYYLTGTITNNTSREKAYVQVTFNLYDKDGNLIGTAFDNINNLKSGGTWKFKAIALVDSREIYSYELAEITGF